MRSEADKEKVSASGIEVSLAEAAEEILEEVISGDTEVSPAKITKKRELNRV